MYSYFISFDKNGTAFCIYWKIGSDGSSTYKESFWVVVSLESLVFLPTYLEVNITL